MIVTCLGPDLGFEESFTVSLSIVRNLSIWEVPLPKISRLKLASVNWSAGRQHASALETCSVDYKQYPLKIGLREDPMISTKFLEVLGSRDENYAARPEIQCLHHRRKFRSEHFRQYGEMKMQRWEESAKRKRRSKKIREEKESEDKMQVRKGRKVAKHCVFPMIWGSGGSKSRLAKAAAAEPAGQMRDEKLHAAVARSTFLSQNVQNTSAPDNFWKLRCQKSACRCGAKHICKWKAKNTSRSDHFWKLRCRKSARRCGAKHISKSKC